jgi:hypothetical protein
MKIHLNFYIHIYNRPTYRIQNHDNPTKIIHLSYHDGEHYNSVRLKEDFEDGEAQDIPMSLLNSMEQTTDVPILESGDNIIDPEEQENEEDVITEINQTEEKSSHKEEINVINNDFIVNGVTIKKIKEKPQKYTKCIMTPEGIIIQEQKDHDKCHCESNKKYKSCCTDKDLKGEYDKTEKLFYCNIDHFKEKISNTSSLNDEKESIDNDVNQVSKKVEKLFISI